MSMAGQAVMQVTATCGHDRGMAADIGLGHFRLGAQAPELHGVERPGGRRGVDGFGAHCRLFGGLRGEVAVDLEVWGAFFTTAIAWHRGAAFEMVQLLWPDRNGFLPTEPGFDRRLTLAQPVIGTIVG